MSASGLGRLIRLVVLMSAVTLSVGSAHAESLVRVFAIRGFAGQAFSRGMNQLCDELAGSPQVVCAVSDYYDAADTESRVAAALAAGERVVMVGHSWGALAALRIAIAVRGQIQLIVTIDPNWFPTPPLVPPNVDVVLNYYQDFDVLGRAVLKPSPAFQGKLQQYRRSEAHVIIDRSEEIHAEIISRVRAIAASANAPPRAAPPKSNRQTR